MKYVFFVVIILFCFSCGPSKEDKTRNGIHLSEVQQPFGPKGLEKHLYDGDFEKFYSQLDSNLLLMKNSKLVVYDTTLSPNMLSIISYKTGIKFWNGEVLLYDLDEPSFLFVDNKLVRLNIHRLSQKENLKVIMRIALINEATNLVFEDPLNKSLERFMKEELLSDFAMSLCPDEETYVKEWFRLVSGRFSPGLNIGEYKKMSNSELGNANVLPLGSTGYIELMREYSSILSDITDQSSEILANLESNQASFLDMICKGNDNCFGEGMITFWEQQLNIDQKKKLKKECEQKFEEELRLFW